MAYPENYPGIKQGVRLVAEGNEAVQLTAVVDRVFDDGRMELGCLDSKRASVLELGQTVELEYFREGAVFKISTTITEAGPRPEPADVKARRQVVVAPPSDVRKIQRRRFTRAFVSVFISYCRVNDPGPDFDITTRKGKKQAAQWLEELDSASSYAFTETLSGSGLRMRIDSPIKNGDFMFLQLDLPDHTVSALGEIVWIGSKPPQEVPGEAIGVDFRSIAAKDRQAILEFVEGHKHR